jgi:lipoprotein-anchoring transpeptidase ErfK/SrfK
MRGKGQAEGESEGSNVRLLLAQADNARIQGSLLEAKRAYQQILTDSPSADVASTVQQRLGEVNMKLITSPTITPDAVTYEVKTGDTLSRIAREFHTTVELLRASNHLKGDLIRSGQRLKVLKADFSLVVDKSQNLLTLKNGEEVVKVYRCSTGEGGITPIGTFKVVNRIVDPPWFTPEGLIPSGDPRNVLGSRWMGFDLPSYGIHGTTDPSSIGKPITQGCVRLANADAEELFTLLPEGTPVTIVD